MVTWLSVDGRGDQRQCMLKHLAERLTKVSPQLVTAAIVTVIIKNNF